MLLCCLLPYHCTLMHDWDKSFFKIVISITRSSSVPLDSPPLIVQWSSWQVRSSVLVPLTITPISFTVTKTSFLYLVITSCSCYHQIFSCSLAHLYSVAGYNFQIRSHSFLLHGCHNSIAPALVAVSRFSTIFIFITRGSSKIATSRSYKPNISVF